MDIKALIPILLTLAGSLLLLEPVLANKFETIGGGVSGSSGIKQQHLQYFLLTAGGACMIGALLAVVTPHSNALYMNCRNWKVSAIAMSVVGGVLLLAAWLV